MIWRDFATGKPNPRSENDMKTPPQWTYSGRDMMDQMDDMADEIRLLRHALLDALTVFDIGQKGSTRFHKAYAEVIARAVSAGKP